MSVWPIFRHDMARWLSRPSFWGLFVLFAALGYGAIQAFAGVFDSFRLMISMGGDTLHVNSPYLVGIAIQTLTAVGLPVAAALFGSAVHREISQGSGALLWTTPLGKWSYWWGRCGAALTLNMILLSGVGLGVWIGTRMPWIDPQLLGTDRLSYYAYPYLSVARRTLLAGAWVTLAVLASRSMLSSYLAVLAMVGMSRGANALTHDLENRTLAALIDPSGGVATHLVTRTWSTADKNMRTVALEGLVLQNLVLWTLVAAALLTLGGLVFKPERQASAPQPGLWGRVLRIAASAWRITGRPFTRLISTLPLWLRWAMDTYRSSVTHPMFLATVLFGLVTVATAATSVTMMFGTPTWPVTYAVLGVFTSVFEPFAVGLVIFLTGHVIWREQRLGLQSLVDPTPHRTWLPAISKLLGLFGVVVTLQGVVMAAGVIYQTYQGFERYRWGTYAVELFGLGLVDLCLLLVLAFFLQILIRQQYLAYFVTVAIYLGVRFSPSMGFGNLLYRYGKDPGHMLSELNGIEPFFTGWWTVKTYWLVLALGLVLLSGWLWPRGVDRDLSARRRQIRRRYTPLLGYLAASTGLLFIGCGSWVYYNTHVLNDYRSPEAAEKDQVRLETELRHRLEQPQPKITDVRYVVDLFPSSARADVAGELKLVNRGTEPVTELLLRVPEQLDLIELTLGGQTAEPVSLMGPYRELTLDTPMLAGGELELSYRAQLLQQGFANDADGRGVIPNGTMIGGALTLGIGYQPANELSDPRRRRRFNLPERAPLPAIDDPRGRHTGLTVDSDWVSFEMVVSTEADQLALAPGDLIHEEEINGRRTFTYRSSVPMQHLWNVVSGSYEVRRESWQGIELEIYHHPDHTDNLDSMMRGMKKSLDYLTRTFGPYPHKALRIVEFPRYATFAMSLPGLIPFSEGIGFIARKRTPDDIDYPLYVTAHEVAHQWFPHRASPAYTEGRPFLSETFSQYVALRVMEEQFGSALIGKFLRYELDRYLLGRSVSNFEERPLATVHHQQHIYYNKGSLAIYAAAELIGRQHMDAALVEYLDRYSYAAPPYPTTSDFLEILKTHADPEHRPILEDLFERITLFDLAVTDSTCEPLENGRYRVGLSIEVEKSYADGEGLLTSTALDQAIEVGIFAEKKVLRKTRPKTLLLKPTPMTSGAHELFFEVDQMPLRAGIDPFFKQVDSDPEDNIVDLTCASREEA